tara:strand:- start:204 stop:497 length:294 start_codon:yes stop_codon:yes gene_type:complete
MHSGTESDNSGPILSPALQLLHQHVPHGAGERHGEGVKRVTMDAVPLDARQGAHLGDQGDCRIGLAALAWRGVDGLGVGSGVGALARSAIPLRPSLL